MHGGRDLEHPVKKYEILRFRPNLFPFRDFAKSGCGMTALMLLTGFIPDEHGRKAGDDWPLEDMIRFLENHDINVYKLGLLFKDRTVTENYVKVHHVVLMQVNVAPDEYSWMVAHDGRYYHNFEIHGMDEYTFVTMPVVRRWLLVDERWVPRYLEGEKIRTAANRQ